MEEQNAQQQQQQQLQQQTIAAYPQALTMGQFQTLAMSQLLQAAASSAQTEHLDGLKAAITGNPAMMPDPKRQKVEGEQATVDLGGICHNEHFVCQALSERATLPCQCLQVPCLPRLERALGF